MAALTPDPALDDLLRRHAGALESVLGHVVVGLYLIGSLAIGDFDQTSDVDFTVVVRDELSDEDVAAVQAVHTRTYAQPTRWAHHLEYAFFPLPRLRELTPMFPQGVEHERGEHDLWFFNHGSPVLERSWHNNSLVTRWTLREKPVTVVGPEPVTFAPEVPADALRGEVRAVMLDWGASVLAAPDEWRNRFFQAYLVLQYCRMLQDLVEGRVTSKREGAEWGRQHLEPRWRPLIDWCWADRQDPDITQQQPADGDVFPQVLQFVEHVMGLAREVPTGRV